MNINKIAGLHNVPDINGVAIRMMDTPLMNTLVMPVGCKPMAKTQIREKFEALNDKFDKSVTLLETPAESCFEDVMDSVASMLEKEKKGVYVTASRPYKYISKEMQKRNINKGSVLFIDCISRMVGDPGDGDCTYVENPASLEEISMYIISLLDKIESDKKFLIMDSISTLLIYNNSTAIKEFSMFLINKLRLEGVNGIMVTIEKQTPEELKHLLISMCDKKVYV